MQLPFAHLSSLRIYGVSDRKGLWNFGVKARKAVDTKSVFGLQFGLSKSFCISLYYVWFSISNFSLTSNPVWTKI